MRFRIVSFIAVLSIISVTVLFFAEKKTQNAAQIIFLDVGQGDATLLVTPLGKTVLVDGGQYGGLGKKLSSYMQAGDRAIDVVIATHPDLDHIGGLADVVSEFTVSTFIHSGSPSQSASYQELARVLKKTNTAIVTAHAGQKINIEPGVWVEILSPYTGYDFGSENDQSIILMVHVFGNKILLTGDAGWEVEAFLARSYTDLHADILKLGHHGSKTSSSQLFLETVHPQYAVASSGCANRFGHPHTEVVRRVEDLGIKILTTCLDGDISFLIDMGGVQKDI